MEEKPAAINTDQIARTLRAQLAAVATDLRPDVLKALEDARKSETNESAKQTLDMLVENALLAGTRKLPLCQDTGTVWVLIEVGSQARVDLCGLQEALDQVVADSFVSEHLRASTVRKALTDRSNPGTNEPAFIELRMLPKTGTDSDAQVTVHTMLKGAGTDNASTVAMLPPGESSQSREDSITQLVLDQVRTKGANACPPLIIGIGVGGTFDKVASLSKHALLRPLNSPAPTKEIAQLEKCILKAVNKTGIGPAGLGGDTTALAVHIEEAPSHIASLPVAINLCCHSLRSTSTTL